MLDALDGSVAQAFREKKLERQLQSPNAQPPPTEARPSSTEAPPPSKEKVSPPQDTPPPLSREAQLPSEEKQLEPRLQLGRPGRIVEQDVNDERSELAATDYFD